LWMSPNDEDANALLLFLLLLLTANYYLCQGKLFHIIQTMPPLLVVCHQLVTGCHSQSVYKILNGITMFIHSKIIDTNNSYVAQLVLS